MYREGRNFKTFSKVNYAIALDTAGTYLLKHVEHGIKHDVDSTYDVSIHYRHSRYLKQIQ